MNGRIAKKIRKVTTINYGIASAGFCRTILSLSFIHRLRFCFSVLFKIPWKERSA
jgi:hypothetical protein